MSDHTISGEIIEICPMELPSRLLVEGAPKTHELKCWPSQFQPMWEGRKPFEFRKADRDYMRGDTLLLREWAPEPKRYMGRQLTVEVTYILHGPRFGVPKGYCIMGLMNLEK